MFAVPATAQIQSTAPELRFIESDQTAPLGRWRLIVTGDTFQIQKNTAAAKDYSTDTDILGITADGYVGIGVAAPTSQFVVGGNVTSAARVMIASYKEWTGSSNYYGASIHTALTSGAGTAVSGIFYAQPAAGGGVALTGDLIGAEGIALTYYNESTPATSINQMFGLQGSIYSDFGNPTVTLAIGVDARPYISAGTFGDVYGFRARGSVFTAGSAINYFGSYLEAPGVATITNAYGQYIEAPTAGSVLNIGLYNGGSLSQVGAAYFTDNIGIGVASPLARLHIAAGTAAANTGQIKFDASTVLTSPEAGVMEFADGRLYITNVAHRRALDRTSDVNLSTVTVADTTDETTLWTATMNANSLAAGNVFKVHADGIVANGGSGADDEVTIRVKVGGVTKATLSPDTKTLAAGTMWHLDANATQRTIGASGARAIHIHLTIGDPISTGDAVHVIGVASIDTTANMDVTITAQWASADESNTISLYQAFMEYKN